MYHDTYLNTPLESGFSSLSALEYKIQIKRFEKHVSYIYKKNAEVIFTFDDGGSSAFTQIAPVLEKYGMRGVFFISTTYIGTPGFMSATEIAQLSQRGHVIGSHGHSHIKDMRLLKYSDLEEEWRNSISILRSIIGKEILHASIPNGNYSNTDLEILGGLGVEEIYTSQPTMNLVKYGMNVSGRIVVKRGTSSPSFKLLILMRKYSPYFLMLRGYWLMKTILYGR